MPIAAYRGLAAIGPLTQNISTASTVVTLTDNDQGVLLIWGGQTSAARIRLPAPEAGKMFRIIFNGPGVSTATKICSSGNGEILINGTTAKAVAFASTIELGAYLEVIGVNDFRYIANGHGSTVNGQTFQSTTT